MAQQTKFAGLGATVDRAGATAWTNPTNVYADDTNVASAAVPTDYLVCSQFGFAIPPAATILGVTLNVKAGESGSGTSNYTAQLQSDATPTLIGSSQTSGTVSGTTLTVYPVGAVTDVWSATLTPAIVNATTFGVSIWSTDTTNTLNIDYVQLVVDYTGSRLAALGVG